MLFSHMLFVCTGEAKLCFECISGDLYDKDACLNVRPTDAGTQFKVNCTDKGEKDGKNYERCRTMVQDSMYQKRLYDKLFYNIFWF